ncbi:hypothetical protein [Prosthecomicrobium pneumaticum]|uniref:Lipoprotein n=1 Tax=Prosthecomicrobium pneumaticum TaxID=81895 RepID=A0A7W9CU87_9HYPH|nr:hypothetical protein [Prosthecomicrobium pneumaticum]MBB5752010.1 hypothetical protein [Prosthecomicrobium pneumaticum]
MGRVRRTGLSGLLVAMAALGLSGCGSSFFGFGEEESPAASTPAANPAATNSPSVLPGASSRPTVPVSNARFSFVSLTGAPASVTGRLSSALGREAATRGLQLAPSGDESATYIVKGYLSAVGDASGTIIVYVWDIFDKNGRRMHRLSGQESISATAADPWGAIDGAVLDAVARRTIEAIGTWGASD